MRLNKVTRARSGLVVCVPLLLLGCGRVPGQFIIIQNQVPTGACVIPADLGSLYRGEGVLDAAVPGSGYQLFPLLENDLPGPTTGQLVDGNRIALRGFDVTITLPPVEQAPGVAELFATLESERSVLIRYSVPTSGSVSSGGGHTAGFVEAIPSGLAALIANTGALQAGSVQIEAHVRARGERLTGNIVSDDFIYPISICDGCLVASLRTCPVTDPPVNKGNPCNVAQDEAVDCCSLAGTLFCPSLVSR